LFCGCGGLSLGVAQAVHAAGRALEIVLAVDVNPAALAVYKANFPAAETSARPVEELFGGVPESPPTDAELEFRASAGRVDAVVGGPPCQGHSNLNNHTRRDDPKNSLYLVMARVAEVLRPDVVMIENVPAVARDKGQVVSLTRRHLETIGYQVDEASLRLENLGVRQRRRRHVLLATAKGWSHPQALLKELSAETTDVRDMRWAVADLAEIEDRSGIDAAPTASAANRERMAWLLKHDKYDLPNSLRPPCHRDDHSYKSMYGRLRWDEPAQTVTSGFGSIGQGRYMHPDQPRALTCHEAARIQGFPDYFDFGAARLKTALSTMIGNAAPPQLGYGLFTSLMRNSSL
jgi:DNA (cytosine-5)-methyltransferase 1